MISSNFRDYLWVRLDLGVYVDPETHLTQQNHDVWDVLKRGQSRNRLIAASLVQCLLYFSP